MLQVVFSVDEDQESPALYRCHLHCVRCSEISNSEIVVSSMEPVSKNIGMKARKNTVAWGILKEAINTENIYLTLKKVYD